MTAFRSRLFVTAGAIALICSSLASADPRDHGRHGDMHRFHDRDYPHWREGRWYHGNHGGHFGWWWIAADMWYFYPAPVYPYPDPYVPPAIIVEPQSPPVSEAPPPATVWYYCKSSRNYYPYVSVCPEGWQTVPAQPSDAPQR